MKSTLD